MQVKQKQLKRKINFTPRELIFVFVNKDNVQSCGKFQANFRNADGSARNPKLMLDIKNNNYLKIKRFKFNNNL